MASDPQPNDVSDETGQTPAGAPATGATCNDSCSPLSGKLGILIFVVLFGTAGYLTYKTLWTAGKPEPDPPEVMYICAETHKTFPYKPKLGDKDPVMSPHSNQRTGYRAELCYCWDAQGQPRHEPTYVLLNEHAGKEGPTLCPSCQQTVRPHNTEKHSILTPAP